MTPLARFCGCFSWIIRYQAATTCSDWARIFVSYCLHKSSICCPCFVFRNFGRKSQKPKDAYKNRCQKCAWCSSTCSFCFCFWIAWSGNGRFGCCLVINHSTHTAGAPHIIIISLYAWFCSIPGQYWHHWMTINGTTAANCQWCSYFFLNKVLKPWVWLSIDYYL